MTTKKDNFILFSDTGAEIEQVKKKTKLKIRSCTFSHLKKTGYDIYAGAEDYYYDPVKATQALNFFEEELSLTLGEWKGQPFIPFGWARDVIMALFGWYNKKTNLRRFSISFIYVPRKNAKSELVAGIANYEFFSANEPDNEIYIGARDRGQASTLHDMASKMVLHNPKLSSEASIYKSTKEIRSNWDSSHLQAVSADAPSQHSKSPGMVIIDELHTQRNDYLIEALRTGMGARKQPMTIYISTADFDRPSICNEELAYAKSVRDNPKLNPEYLPVIYEAATDADWTSEKVWKKCNPSYPVTPNKKFLSDWVREAKNNPRKESTFKRLYLNMKTATSEGWLKMEIWRMGNEDFKESELEGQKCYMGLDLASKIDLSSLAMFFPESCRLVLRFYCPQLAVTEEKTGHYEEWIDDGEMVISGESITDYRFIRADIEKFAKIYDVRQIGFDPHNANNLINELTDIFQHILDSRPDFMIEFGQTYANYCDPCKTFEAMVIENTLKHNSAILNWMASNVSIKEGPSGDIRPVKPSRGSPLKIDGIVASIMAIGLATKDKDNEEPNIYEERGMIDLSSFLDE